MRNIRCPQYSGCLDRAVLADRDFDCTSCQHRYEVAPLDLDERFNCCILLLAVFFPVAYTSHLQEFRKAIQTAEDAGEDETELPGEWGSMGGGEIV